MDLKPLPADNLEERQYYGLFHGNISIELPPDRPHIQRSGYAAWRTLQRRPTIFGRPFWNCDPFAYLALRVKSDGSKYFVNIQTDSIVETDIHQHRLFAKRVGEWEVIHVWVFFSLCYRGWTDPRWAVDSVCRVCPDKSRPGR